MFMFNSEENNSTKETIECQKADKKEMSDSKFVVKTKKIL